MIELDAFPRDSIDRRRVDGPAVIADISPAQVVGQ
jgi:hypothetical protein